MSGINIVGGATSTSISNNNTFNYNYNYFTGTCSTDGATADKVVTSTSNITLATGLRILVTFDNANTVVGTLTLNVNSTGAIAIYTRDGVEISATNLFRNLAGETCEFYYNGTYWIVDITKTKVANYAMPSNTYDTLTLSVSGTTFTAPANGYYKASINLAAGGFFAFFRGSSSIDANIDSLAIAATTQNYAVKSEVKKGDQIHVTYLGLNLINSFRFYYAQGEV